ILRELHAYIDVDRRMVITRAQAQGRYQLDSEEHVLLDDRKMAFLGTAAGSAKLSQLSPDEKRLLLVNGPSGLEPASLWLTEDGLPMSISSWKVLFQQTNDRCTRHYIIYVALTHMLRLTYV